MPRALAWAVLAGGLALAGLGVQRAGPAGPTGPAVAATAEAVAATGRLLQAWQAGRPAAAGAWVAPAAAGPGGAWLAGLEGDLAAGLPVPGKGPEGGDGPAPGAAPGRTGRGAAPPSATGAGAERPSATLLTPQVSFLRTPVTAYATGPARPDALGRIHVQAVVDVAVPAAGYAGRFVQDLWWRPGPGGPRLVAATRRPDLEVAVQGDRLAWRREGGPWQPGLGLADLPLRAAPVGGPPGVQVDVSRDGFGPLALAGGRGVLLVTGGPRPLVALWSWPAGGRPSPGPESLAPGRPSPAPDRELPGQEPPDRGRPGPNPPAQGAPGPEAGGQGASGQGARGQGAGGPEAAGPGTPGPEAPARVVVLDVLYHARGLRWQVDPGGRRATLEVEREDGSRVLVTYDLD
ncbi:MAG TPA: hypothetical protein VIL38_08420, partial [Thermaerobacter sp.]